MSYNKKTVILDRPFATAFGLVAGACLAMATVGMAGVVLAMTVLGIVMGMAS